jgi:3-hydroxyacyl-[acyl-carrier-protein] dehydratase
MWWNASMSQMDIQAICEILPHRYPFLLVDRVTELEEGKSVVGYKNVTMNEEFFKGHFPGHPIMPGVLILEALAQVAGVLGLVSMGDRRTPGTLYYFAGANNVRFKRPVLPGDRLELKANLKAAKRAVWVFDCEAYVDGNLVCQAEIKCAEKETKS